MSSSRTITGTRRLSDVARRLHLPDGIVSTGWPQVAHTSRHRLGIEYDDWQHGIGRLALSKRADGRLATTIDGIGLSAPRQVGKTYLFAGLLFSLCIDRPGLLVIWSAHHSRTHDETFLAMRAFAQRSKVEPFIRHVHTGSGDEEIAFTNGSRILFGAREAGFGRGIPGVDVLIFDEAQILSEKALANMLATMNTSDFGLHVYIGTPPKPEDAGKAEVFTRMRRQAAAGELPDGAWVEIGAEPDSKPDDRAVWARMNPSYPRRTSAEAIMRLRRKLSEGDFRREGMGIWDADAGLGSRLIPAADWDAAKINIAPPDGIRCMAMVFDFDSPRGALAGAVRHAGGVHLELIDSGPVNIDALAGWLGERWRGLGMIAIAGGPSRTVLQQRLRELKVPARTLRVLNTPEYFAACAMLLDGFTQSRGVTIPAPEDPTLDALEASAAISDRKVSPSGWRWLATTPEGDKLPMEAISVALWAARNNKRQPGRRQVVS